MRIFHLAHGYFNGHTDERAPNDISIGSAVFAGLTGVPETLSHGPLNVRRLQQQAASMRCMRFGLLGRNDPLTACTVSAATLDTTRLQAVIIIIIISFIRTIAACKGQGSPYSITEFPHFRS